jgi:hypothetical protein
MVGAAKDLLKTGGDREQCLAGAGLAVAGDEADFRIEQASSRQAWPRFIGLMARPWPTLMDSGV